MNFSSMCEEGIFYYSSQCVWYRIGLDYPWSFLITLGLIVLLLIISQWIAP